MFNAKDEAISIISEFTASMIHTGSRIPKSWRDDYDAMVDKCSDILVHKWLNHEYSFMEYYEVRNELSRIL